MKDWVTSKLRLPNLNGIRIDCISDADADLANFLSYWITIRLQKLEINLSPKSWIGIKSKFYVDAFSEAARRTTGRVYFRCIDFSAEDFQTVVRAAHNAEEIVFSCCCIHCSSDLDFGGSIKYYTKVLSFDNWGSTYSKERTTDWKADPSTFSFIVDAIGSSGLKDSLTKLNIRGNMTLSVSKVQEEIDAKGMSHISVVEESFDRLNDKLKMSSS